MRTMSIKTKVILIIAVCLTVGAVALIGFVNKSYKDNVQLVAQQSVDNAQKSFLNLEQNDYRALDIAATSLMTDDKMREIYLSRNRQALYDYTTPIYKDLKARFGINVFLFIDPDKTTFLRMLTPAKFGDKLKLQVLDACVATKQSTVGSELGKAGYALRCIRPYYDKSGKLIGYVDIGDSYDSFLETMNKQTGDQYIMVGDKSILEEETYRTGQQRKGLKDYWDEFKNVVVLSATTEDHGKSNFDAEMKNLPAGGRILGEVKKGDKMYVRGVFPLVDFSKKPIGGVFVTHDVTPLYVGMQRVKTSATVAIVILMAVISLTILSVLNKLVFARLKQTMQVATRVVGGEFETQIVPESDDEVGQLESLLEQFRVVFVNVAGELERQQSQPDQLKKSA